MSAGDKDRSGFHRVGGSLTQARSRDSTKEHEHCSPHMLTDLPGSSACGILGLGRTRRLRCISSRKWLELRRPDGPSRIGFAVSDWEGAIPFPPRFQEQPHILDPIRGFVGAQDDGDRLAGRRLVDVDGLETATIVMGIEQRELLCARQHDPQRSSISSRIFEGRIVDPEPLLDRRQRQYSSSRHFRPPSKATCTGLPLLGLFRVQHLNRKRNQ
jgi:hypothetical protein